MRDKVEPLLIVARMTTPFISGEIEGSVILRFIGHWESCRILNYWLLFCNISSATGFLFSFLFQDRCINLSNYEVHNCIAFKQSGMESILVSFSFFRVGGASFPLLRSSLFELCPCDGETWRPPSLCQRVHRHNECSYSAIFGQR